MKMPQWIDEMPDVSFGTIGAGIFMSILGLVLWLLGIF